MARIKIEDLADAYELNHHETAHFRGGSDAVTAATVQPVRYPMEPDTADAQSGVAQPLSNLMKMASDTTKTIVPNIK